MKHQCDHRLYEDYFLRQVGNGYPPPYSGTRMQNGYGIFASISKAIIPLMKMSAKALGRKALRTVPKIATGLLEGKKPSRVFRGALTDAGGELFREGLQHFNKPIKRRAPTKKISRGVNSRKKRKKDIFG